MILINYTTMFLDDEKTSTETCVAMTPIYIDSKYILSVRPMITTKGRLFKNVSYLQDKFGNDYKVVGNYKKIAKKIRIDEHKKIGYK